ncbi:phage portal protein [Noviherbaspirillum denitrificans]|uniref:phage portal protein n=1 Tax=Noviherbaspirillum denitrificans TaxID=1968433 RepID=UPI0014831410|nr:phage portal protein [Noviherbaspirillum denitrificans]
MKEQPAIVRTEPVLRPIRVRTFAAASSSRLTAGWNVSNVSADADIFRSLDVMRARSRDLGNNNDYFRKFLNMVGNGVVGPKGHQLQCQVTDPGGKKDELANNAIEAAFLKWAKRGVCDVTGRLSFVDIQKLFIKSVARDGEILIRRVRGKTVNAFGYALQVLDISRLPVAFNQTLSNGNFIRMGIEMNSYGRPVAYHLLTLHPGESMPVTINGQSVRVERVPADDIFHCFVPELLEQSRGIPWAHAAMLRMNMLAGYEEAVVVAARTGAAKMGFFTSPDGDAEPLSDGEDEEGEFVTDADPGTFSVLPKGYDFKAWDPDYPAQNTDVFIKLCLRGIASGLLVSYNSLANDLEGVNFSSIRAGLLEERDVWMALQAWMVESFCEPVFMDWLQMALMRGAITMPNGSALPIAKLEKFGAHAWQSRRWAWVDPLKDVEANMAAVRGGLKSRKQIITEQGGDIDEVFQQLAAEEEEARRLKINLSGEPVPPTPDPAPAPAAEE